ncbi:MAG: outer membrane protein transport protein [Kiritimatiellae bacterium]|nr:outer membrane protein transport protein [Kiritimatiellia bacterium]
MNEKLAAMAATGSLVATTAAYGAGFALYQGSAAGNALGGGLVGKAYDASANYYNPATLADLTNTTVTVGFITEHPTTDVSVDHKHGRKMDPGGFVIPHFHVAQPMPYGFTFGLGFGAEYGLGTHYHQSWDLASDTRDTTIEGFVLNPNLAYSITDDWSVSAGFRVLYFTFDQHSMPDAVSANGARVGTMRNHIHADNGFADWGWQLSTRYKILDNLSAGLMYKSYIDTKVRGTSNTRVRYRDYSSIDRLKGTPYYSPYKAAIDKGLDDGARSHTGSGGADLRLPQSLTAGLNWDVTDTFHVGASVTWTQWSCIQEIDFDLPGGHQHVPLKWDDTIRAGFGLAWDFHDNFTAMGSYVYDQDPCSGYWNCTMLPPGDRHIMTFGLGWHWENWEVVASYGIVFMCTQSTPITNRATGETHTFDTHGGWSHSAGMSVTYRF